MIAIQTRWTKGFIEGDKVLCHGRDGHVLALPEVVAKMMVANDEVPVELDDEQNEMVIVPADTLHLRSLGN